MKIKKTNMKIIIQEKDQDQKKISKNNNVNKNSTK